jgi:lipopolysaccharide/colanic/teichoic acid biosynthesis glycosyltransferase
MERAEDSGSAGVVQEVGTEVGHDLAGAVPSDQRRHRWVDAALKRVLDVVVAVVVLMLTLPLLALAALAIVIESPGPVFYRSHRVGRRGRLLRMLKFRKMRRHASGLKLTMGDDPRLTRVGRVLTRTKLDELPQFWHVLRGEMSLIGPRPEDPGFVACRANEYDEILSVRPGITGFSQLAFAQESRILAPEDPVTHYVERILPQKCALDRLYVRDATFRTDLRILLWTLLAVVMRLPVAVDRASGATTLRRRGRPELSCAGAEPRSTELSAPLQDHAAASDRVS